MFGVRNQRNDLLNYCLECLFYAGLQEIDITSRRPAELVKVLADRAMADIPGDANSPTLPALPIKVADWIAATRLPDTPPGGDSWGPLSTWALADRLESAVADADMDVVPGLAVRLLGRLATDRGRCGGSNPFAPIPNAVEMASNHEVHLRRWWDRTESRSSEGTAAFLEELLIEWVIYRHLRVATRKLANQGCITCLSTARRKDVSCWLLSDCRSPPTLPRASSRDSGLRKMFIAFVA